MQNYNDLRSRPEYNILHESWKRFKRQDMLCSEWKDFEKYFKWAIKSGWEIGVKVFRVDSKKPASPRNCYLVFGKVDAMKHIKGGSANRPCNHCLNETPSGCVNYDTCIRYRNWLNKCWEDFRIAAGLEAKR